MKNIFAAIILFLSFTAADAQHTSIYTQKGYQLTFISYDNQFDPALQQRMVKTFYTVYPQLAKAFNKNTLKAVTMVIDTTYKGVAETDNGKVTISSKWMHQHPEDIDVITHEVMHIVQNYGGDTTDPGWLVEGIADYARYKFGLNNVAANWELPQYKLSQNYTDAYRVTARFLVWLEERVKPGIVNQLDSQMRDHNYTYLIWQQQTGQTLDQLWKIYSQNPVIDVTPGS